MHHMDADREKAGRELPRNATTYIEQIYDATSHESAALRPSTPSL